MEEWTEDDGGRVRGRPPLEDGSAAWYPPTLESAYL